VHGATLIFGLVVLAGCLTGSQDHSPAATRKLTATVDSVTTALAEGFSVQPPAPPDAAQSCVGTFNNDKGTVTVGYNRQIAIPPGTDGPALPKPPRHYLETHACKADKPEPSVDPHASAVSAGQNGYNLVIDVNPKEGRVSLSAGTPCVKP